MRTKKHKRKTNHMVIVTSDAVDGQVRHLRFNHWVTQILMVIFCVVIGYVAGLIIYGEQYKSRIWDTANRRIEEIQAENEQLQEQLTAAESE